MKHPGEYLDKKYLFPLFAGFLVFLIVKLFWIDVLVVKSPAMLPAVKQGSWQVIKKIFTPKQNDVVLISLPLSLKDSAQERSKVLKRIVGMPGDTVAVINSQLYINGKLYPGNENFLHNYIAKIERQSDSVVLDRDGIEEKYLIDDSCVYLLTLNIKKFNALQEEKKMYSLLPNKEDSAIFDDAVFPNVETVKWNKDFFGPLYIPKMGDELKLDINNIKLFERIITVFEGNALDIEKGKIYINEEETYTYHVKQNYYFVTGDNFDNSIDSRHWGFVPENKLKAVLLFNK